MKIGYVRISTKEQNTQRAAQYAELGANYSKANAFFSLATYLKTSR